MSSATMYFYSLTLCTHETDGIAMKNATTLCDYNVFSQFLNTIIAVLKFGMHKYEQNKIVFILLILFKIAS